LPDWERNTGTPIVDRYDVVLTNPPFGSKIGLKDPATLQNFAFGHLWAQHKTTGKWVQTDALSGDQDPQILFLELCVKALRPEGRMGIVLPEGVFGNKQTSYVWDWLESQGEIFALLDCPRTTFQPGTDTKTNVLFFRKSLDHIHVSALPATRVAVALHCGHDRRGRSHLANGKPQTDDFAPIATAFHDPKQSREHWRTAKLRGERYLVPRYYFGRDEVLPGEHEIANGARFATLGELVKEKTIRIRNGHEIGSQAYGTGEIPFVRTSDLSNFEISADPTKSVSEQVYEEFGPQQNLKAGDILMVVDGRYRIGTTALLTDHNVRCLVQSHLRIISALKPKTLDPYELLYALNLPTVKLRVRSLVFIQSTLGTLGSRILELRIPILHGDGPWAIRVARFREALQRRSALLSDLQAMSGPDYEL
jgi:type I restriction enzyme M protein